eukprot:7386838-Lingulodinium_polyedra.AAC.1
MMGTNCPGPGQCAGRAACPCPQRPGRQGRFRGGGGTGRAALWRRCWLLLGQEGCQTKACRAQQGV